MTRITPALAEAYWTSTHSAQFGLQIPSRSPGSQAERREPAGDAVDLGVELRVGPADVLMARRRAPRGRRGRATVRSRFAPIVSPSSGTSEVPCAYESVDMIASSSWASNVAGARADAQAPALRPRAGNRERAATHSATPAPTPASSPKPPRRRQRRHDQTHPDSATPGPTRPRSPRINTARPQEIAEVARRARRRNESQVFEAPSQASSSPAFHASKGGLHHLALSARAVLGCGNRS